MPLAPRLLGTWIETPAIWTYRFALNTVVEAGAEPLVSGGACQICLQA